MGFASGLTPSFPWTYRYLLIPVLLICYPLATSSLLYSPLKTAAWLSILKCPGNISGRPSRHSARLRELHGDIAAGIPALLASPSTQPALNQKPTVWLPSTRSSIFKRKADGTEQFPLPSTLSFPEQGCRAAGRSAPAQPSCQTPSPGHGQEPLLTRSILPPEGAEGRQRCCT